MLVEIVTFLKTMASPLNELLVRYLPPPAAVVPNQVHPYIHTLPTFVLPLPTCYGLIIVHTTLPTLVSPQDNSNTKPTYTSSQ